MNKKILYPGDYYIIKQKIQRIRELQKLIQENLTIIEEVVGE